MANSTTNLDGIVQGQGSQEIPANALFDAAYPATLYARRASNTTGTLTLTASTTNYIVSLKSSGAVSVSTATTNWNDTTNYWRVYSVVTGTATVTSYTDYREMGRMTGSGEIYSQTLSFNSQSDSYTLVLGDAYKYVRMTKATANNLTVPLNSTVAFVTGTQIHIRQAGAGQVTVVATGGVTINTAETLKLRKQHATATLVKVGTNEWDLMGDLETLP
jgi:hypothetical protein